MVRRLFLTLLVLASGCSELTTDPFVDFFGDPSGDGSEPEEFVGVVESINLVRTERGPLPLMGPNTALLRNLIRAKVELRGYRDRTDTGRPTALYVIGIRVLEVDGLPALDGMLEGAAGDLWISNAQGTTPLPALVPPGLVEHLGKRVWVTLDKGVCVRFGVVSL
jgi:hypothetical protein